MDQQVQHSINIPLPAKVERIEVQKKSTLRYSLFSKNGFMLGVSDNTLIKFNLKKGSVVDERLYNKILFSEDKWKVRGYLLRLLGRRDHTSHELKQKGIKKGYNTTILDKVIPELEEKGYIDNKVFARKFTRDKFRFNNWGTNKVRIELRKKGVSSTIINQSLQEITPKDSTQAIFSLVKKNKQKFLRAEKSKRRKKVFDFLTRKGYDSGIILKEINPILDLIEDNEKHHP